MSSIIVVEIKRAMGIYERLEITLTEVYIKEKDKFSQTKVYIQIATHILEGCIVRMNEVLEEQTHKLIYDSGYKKKPDTVTIIKVSGFFYPIYLLKSH